MGFKEAFANFKRNFCNYREYEGKINLLDEGLKNANEREQKELIEMNLQLKKKDELIEIKDLLIEEYESQAKGLNPVDSYCLSKGYKINNFVYKDKVIIGNARIPCNMREMITPNSYVVEKVRKSISKPESRLLWYQRIMNKVADMVEWTADGRDDNYYYPAYTLTIGFGDCEDHAFAQCSIEPELGTAFGFYMLGGKKTGHAFAIGIVGGELWIFDATPDVSEKVEGSKNYSINYIITQKSIYVVNDDTDFGDILWG